MLRRGQLIPETTPRPTAELVRTSNSTQVKLRGEHLSALQSALLEDSDLIGLRRLTRQQFGVELDTIVSSEKNLTQITGELVNWAARGEIGVKALLNAALQINPSGPHLRALAAEWADNEFDPVPICPYPGMLPFDAKFARYFFGREREIEKIRQRLRVQPLLVIIGPSASGKSSLLRAGLATTLERHSLSEDKWTVRQLRPGAAPMQNLATAVSDLFDIEHGALKLDGVTPIAIFVDQFEDVFTQGKCEAASFMASIQTISRIQGVRVVLALASEFFTQLQTSPIWGDAESNLVSILPLDAENLRSVIVKPAEAQGVMVDPALVERLVAEAAGAAGILPFLQETLVMLWERLKTPQMTLEDYEQIAAASEDERSGLEIAMELHADSVLRRPECQADLITVKRIFIRLVQFGEGHPHTRRQQTKAQLQSGGNADAVNQILTVLVASHLVISLGSSGGVDDSTLIDSADQDDCELYYDLAHDKLITGWPQLRKWIAELESGEIQRRRLENKAKEHKRLGQDSGLLDAKELTEADVYIRSDAGAILGASQDLLDLIATSRAMNNPGWNRWGLIIITGLPLALALWVGVIALGTFTQQSSVRIGVWLSIAILIVVGFLGLAVTTRNKPHVLEHWSQFFGRQRLFRYLLIGVIAGALLAYALVGKPLYDDIQYCESMPRHFELPDGDVIHVALINEGFSVFNAQIVNDTLAEQPKIKAWSTTAADAARCSMFFHKVVSLQEMNTSAREKSLVALVNGEVDANQPKVFEDSCFEVERLAYLIVNVVDKSAPFHVATDPAGDDTSQTQRCEVMLLNNQAVEAIKAGNLDSAAVMLIRALEIAPDYDLAHGSLADIERMQGDMTSAIKHYTAASQLAPNNPVYLHKLADSYHDLFLATNADESFSQAEAYYQRTIAVDDHFVASLNGLASLYITKSVKLDEARRYLDTAASLLDSTNDYPPQQATLYKAAVAKNSGLLSNVTGDYERAVADFKRADELGDWYDSLVLNELSKAYDAMGEGQLACNVRSRLAQYLQSVGAPAPAELSTALASCNQ